MSGDADLDKSSAPATVGVGDPHASRSAAGSDSVPQGTPPAESVTSLKRPPLADDSLSASASPAKKTKAARPSSSLEYESDGSSGPPLSASALDLNFYSSANRTAFRVRQKRLERKWKEMRDLEQLQYGLIRRDGQEAVQQMESLQRRNAELEHQVVDLKAQKEDVKRQLDSTEKGFNDMMELDQKWKEEKRSLVAAKAEVEEKWAAEKQRRQRTHDIMSAQLADLRALDADLIQEGLKEAEDNAKVAKEDEEVAKSILDPVA